MTYLGDGYGECNICVVGHHCVSKEIIVRHRDLLPLLFSPPRLVSLLQRVALFRIKDLRKHVSLQHTSDNWD